MPIAYHNTFRNHIDGTVCIIKTRLPFAKTGGFSIQEPISPDPQFPSLLLQMFMNRLHLTRKQFGSIPSAATRALVITDNKNFIHTCMKRIGFKDIAEFVNHCKQYRMQIGMEGTITQTVKIICVWPYIFFGHLYIWRFIKLGVNAQ